LANSCICSKRGAGTEKSMRTILGASMSGIFNFHNSYTAYPTRI
jgi:hypothetical protein